MLAVDLALLNFTRDLFVRLPPNVSSFTEAVEMFLKRQGYPIEQGNLHHRFGMAYNWYSVLCDTTYTYLRHILNGTRESSQVDPPLETGSRSETAVVDPPSSMETASGPTEYLRQRCPLCFGGHFSREPGDRTPDIIVCLDACFTQKRRWGSVDSADLVDAPSYPSIFLSKSDINSMEQYVNHRRSAPGAAVPDDGQDGYEGSLKVPASVLDGCNDSFTAADERRQKASTQFFADAGLMVILCQHDQVLWLANMTSAGEKQFYALALIKKLFENIPSTLMVGLLYDIACQLHWSFIKHNFLPDYHCWLTFAISVFHAYGHQWPCQVIYHPHKCQGFGLSDGEGCERFWSSIKKLILTLWVSGFYQRLSVLDNQVRHLCQASLGSLGDWLAWKWYRCQELKHNTKTELKKIGITRSVLRDQWSQQVQKQTKPVPRQSKLAGRRAVKALLILEQNLMASQKRIRQLEGQLTKDTAIGPTLWRWGWNFKRHDNAFLQLRVNAWTVKTRLHDQLCLRKDELERLERSYRLVINERKLASNVESAIKRREPGISKLAKVYNDLCKQMQDLIRCHKAPRNVTLPLPIDAQKLFTLDVDDEIWQDVGLEDDEDGTVPLWLADAQTCDGIRHLLTLDHCLEEEARLKKEWNALQQWMWEEWSALQQVHTSMDVDDDINYQLELRRKELLDLCQRWQASVQVIPGDETAKVSWGPTPEDLITGAGAQSTVEDMLDNMYVEGLHATCGDNNDDEFGEHMDCESDTDDTASGDEDIWEEAELLALSDLHRYECDDAD